MVAEKLSEYRSGSVIEFVVDMDARVCTPKGSWDSEKEVVCVFFRGRPAPQSTILPSY